MTLRALAIVLNVFFPHGLASVVLSGWIDG